MNHRAHAPRRIILSLPLAVAAALALLSGGCFPTAVDPARVRDLGTSSFAGLEIDKRSDLPPNDHFRESYFRERFKSHALTPERLSVWGIKKGEIVDFAIEYTPVDTSDAKEKAEPRVVCIKAEPRWEDANTVEERLAKFEIQLGELAAVHEDLGGLFNTSLDRCYAAIGFAVADDPTPVMESLVAVYDPAFFERSNCWRLEEFERRMASDPQYIPSWGPMFSLAESLGSKRAAAILRKIESAGDSIVAPQLSEIAASYEAGSIETRCSALHDAAKTVVGAHAKCGTIPPKAGAAFDQLRDRLVQQLAAEADDARKTERVFDADAYDALVACLEQNPSPFGVDEAFVERARVFSTAQSLPGLNLSQRIRCHHELQVDLDTASKLIQLYAQSVRSRLLAELRAGARDMAAAGRHATACCRYLLAHGVRHGAAALNVKPEAIEAARVRLGERPDDESDLDRAPRDPTEPPRVRLQLKQGDESDLDRARREALVLLTQVLPFLNDGCANQTHCAGLPDDWLLADTNIGKRLGLVMGSLEEQKSFRAACGSEPLALEISAYEIKEITSRTSSDTARQQVQNTRTVSNSAAVNEWAAKVNSLASRISGTSSLVSANQGLSQQVTGTLGFKEYVYVGEDHQARYYEEVRPYETAASALRRNAAAERASELSDELVRLEGEYETLLARRPPDAVQEDYTYFVEYPRQLQSWVITVERTCTLKGGTTDLSVSGAQVLTPVYARVQADPTKAVAALDEWRDETDIRLDHAFFNTYCYGFARLAMHECLLRRVDALHRAISEGTLSDTDKTTERYWLYYLFTDLARNDDKDLADIVAQQDERITDAFTGKGEGIPAEK